VSLLIVKVKKKGLWELSYCDKTGKWGCVSFHIATEQQNVAV
jgi:hypothetical protein